MVQSSSSSRHVNVDWEAVVLPCIRHSARAIRDSTLSTATPHSLTHQGGHQQHHRWRRSHAASLHSFFVQREYETATFSLCVRFLSCVRVYYWLPWVFLGSFRSKSRHRHILSHPQNVCTCMQPRRRTPAWLTAHRHDHERRPFSTSVD